MDTVRSGHPTQQILSSFGLGKLNESLARAVSIHLELCPECRKQVGELPADSFLGRVRNAKPADQPESGKSQFTWSKSMEGMRDPDRVHANTVAPELADHPDYEIIRELGRGGMGVVYLAHNKLMGRDEVLKVMGRHIMERPGVLDRFLREIRAVAQLRHPNIVTAYHATRLGESIVFAMEYVAGLDLSRMIKSKGPMPVAHACYFAYQAALGLQHAHEEGLVHRDIKPGNLMLSHRKDKATIKILDFGLAKATREEKIDLKLTSEGQALGTPDYIAPEQIIDAMSADIRADIYSLGGTLYHLLTGRPPFQADSLYDMYQAHISRDAELLNFVRPEVPAELAALVAKMMAKELGRRFQTPGELAEALTPFFKKGNVAITVKRLEVSRDGRSATCRPATGAVSTSTERPTDADRPRVRAEQKTDATVLEPQWESLIEVRKTERSLDDAPEVEPTRRPPWKKWPIALASSLFGLIALGVIIITIRDKNGLETKITVPDGSTVVVEVPRKNVELKPPVGGQEAAGGVLTAPVDLLRMIDVRRSNTRGKWERLGSSLLAVAGEYDEIQVPYEPPDEYRLEITAERVSGRNDFQVGIYFPTGQCFIVLDGWGGQISGINGVDGNLANQNETTYRGSVFADAGPTRLVVTVRKNHIQANANGNQIIDWSGNESRLTLRDLKWTPNAGRLGVHVSHPEIGRRALFLAAQYPAGYRIDQVTLTPLSDPVDRAAQAPKGKPPTPPAATKQLTGHVTSPPEPIVNSMGMRLVPIPTGEFLMGSPERQGDDDEHPRHRVRINRPFYLGVTEVTQGQYQRVVGSNPSCFSPRGRGKDKVVGQPTDNHPVENVSWLDAVTFCNELSEREHMPLFYEIEAGTARVRDWNGPGYRLPTEAEREYACRANSQSQYSFGDNEASLGEHGWYNSNSGGRTHPVGEKRPNSFGLFDTHGNVCEWCWDAYAEDYYKESPVDDPLGPPGAAVRAHRDGSWGHPPQWCRSTERYRRPPGFRDNGIGFRLARNVADAIRDLSRYPKSELPVAVSRSAKRCCGLARRLRFALQRQGPDRLEECAA
jgi:serine/threonine protein kinase/formylglycine-generating enzyme required for sulfatase activity